MGRLHLFVPIILAVLIFQLPPIAASDSELMAPFLTAPENDSYVRGSELELSWSTVGDAANYRLLFDNDPDFSSPLENRVLAEPRYTMSLPQTANTSGRQHRGTWLETRPTLKVGS